MEKKGNALLEFMKGHKVLLTAVAVVLVVVAAVFCALNSLLPNSDRVVAGVIMDGTDLGGMTLAEVQEVLSKSDYYSGKTLVFVGAPDTEEISGDDIGLRVDEIASSERAYSVCRGGNWFENVVDAVKLRLEKRDIVPAATANEALDAVIYNRGVRKNGEMQEMRLEEASDAELHIIPQTTGQSKDVSESRKSVLSQIESGNTDAISLDLPISSVEPLTAKQLYDMIYIEPANAEYTIENNKLYITDEIVGRSADMSEIEEKIELFNGGKRIIVSITKTLPEVTAKSLNDELFATELANYSSKYSTSTANRAFNVSRAAASVNDTILMPGEVFSYNETIGNPSLANGYKIASVYENGRQTEGVGGGVCQVSSTLYSAVLYANLEIVERRSHSLTVAYVPKGQDATVSYDIVDFKFRNNTDNPIKIEANAAGGLCRVRILGAKPAIERKVVISHSTVSVNQPTVNETPNASMNEGERKVTSSGKTGYVVDSVRTVIENGVEVKREQLTRSTYKMVPTEVMVGTKAKETPAPAETPAPIEIPDPTQDPAVTTPESTSDPALEITPEPAQPVSEPENEEAEAV